MGKTSFIGAGDTSSLEERMTRIPVLEATFFGFRVPANMKPWWRRSEPSAIPFFCRALAIW